VVYLIGWGGGTIETLDFVAFTVNLLTLNQLDIFKRYRFIF